MTNDLIAETVVLTKRELAKTNMGLGSALNYLKRLVRRRFLDPRDERLARELESVYFLLKNNRDGTTAFNEGLRRFNIVWKS